MQATSPKSIASWGASTPMKQLRRRSTRAILIPFALFALVIGSSLPASAYDDGEVTTPPATPAAPASAKPAIGPLSLKW
jgi:hypothetical protein